MIMNWRRGVAAIVALMTLCGTARADILTAGPVYGGSGQLNGRVFCFLFNTGSNNVTIPTRQIWNSTKGSVALAGDSCGISLAPGRTCEYFANMGAGTYTCRAITNGIEENVSGTMQMLTSADHLLLTLRMKK